MISQLCVSEVQAQHGPAGSSARGLQAEVSAGWSELSSKGSREDPASELLELLAELGSLQL